jgi:hypothetical protein
VDAISNGLVYILQQFSRLPEERTSFHRISISLLDFTNSNPIHELSEFFSRIHILRELILDTVTIEWLCPIGTLRQVYRLPPGSFDLFLRACPLLEKLVLVAVGVTETATPAPAVYTLPCLTDLTLEGLSIAILNRFYSTIRAPAVRSLVVDITSTSTFPQMSGLIRRSSLLSLESIEIHSWCNKPHNDMLAMLPSLQKLHIYHVYLSPEDIDRFTPGTCCGSVETCTHYNCPKLSEVYMNGLAFCSPSQLSDMVEARLVTSKNKKGSRIHEFQVELCPSPRLDQP